MDKIKSFLKKFKKRKGFSLIELLVVVGIMGTLAAVAIPAYNKYRKNAAEGAFTSTASNVGRAFHACMAVNPFTDCDSLAKINVDCNQCLSVTHATAPNFCVNLEEEIAGQVYKGCVTSDAASGKTVLTLNIKSCYDEAGVPSGSNPHSCTGAAYDAACDPLIVPLVECSSDSDCVGGGTGNYCQQVNGTCDTTSALCT